ncbi:DUF6053 domain-containing protein [Lysobacter enzymogenes]
MGGPSGPTLSGPIVPIRSKRVGPEGPPAIACAPLALSQSPRRLD